MAIVSRPALKYSGHQSENLHRAIKTLGEHVKQLSMGEVRLIVCKVSGGSYARVARYLAFPPDSHVCLNIEQARMHRDLVRAMSEYLTNPELRKIITWSGELLRDLESIEGLDAEETTFGKEPSRYLA